MAKRFRVIAHGMHETEIDAAQRVISKPQRTQAFVVGEADAAQIKLLENDGLVVQTLSEIDEQGQPFGVTPETAGSGGSPVPGQLRSISFATRSFRARDDVDLTRPNVYLIQIKGPLLDEYRVRLEAVGVKLLEAFRDGFYSAFLTPQQAGAVRLLDFVAGAKLYESRDTAPGAAAGLSPLAEAAVSPGAKRMLTVDVRLHRAEDVASVTAWLGQRNVAIAGSSGRKIRIYVLEDAPALTDLSSLPEVHSFEEYVAPKLFNDRARDIMTINRAGGPALPYDGSGQIVAVADTGLDEQHPDFQGRIAAVIARGRPGNATDPHGHGTHVAGSVLGDGSASVLNNGSAAAGAFKGTAPAARLFFQSLLDNQGGLGGLPLDLGDLFEEAYVNGARIHNNSWGAATTSTYTFTSSEVDEFVARRRDMLVVFAAGNEGQAVDRRNSPVGFVDWLSIGAPGTAKNALTVGASRSDRMSGGLSGFQWGQAWARNFPDPPIGSEKVSGDPECLAAFSSRGPSDDRRIKPDVVAPGTDILSCKSNIAPIQNFWGPYAASARYAYMGGTSMATPLVSGCAALVRQYYLARGHDPSAALLRATLINGARWLNGQDSNGSNPPGVTPAGNFDQGFGRIDMSATLPHPGAPNLNLEFVDNWQKPAEQLAQTGTRRRYTIDVGAGRVLRICLAYNDLPGRGLQNNLNLFVQAPNGQKFMGNQQLRHSLNIPDVDNNVEIVRIANPQAGPYVIQVSATNLLRKPQDFALVVSGELTGSLAAI